MWIPILITLICNLVASEPLRSPSDDAIIKENKQKQALFYMKLPGIVQRKYLNTFTRDIPNVEHDEDLINSLPESFDLREKWPHCQSLNEIRDQGRCGSCWALSTVAAMTDRVCIYSNGTKNFHFSALDGCHGGNPFMAWQYWVDTGLVSGGNHGSDQGCKPYSIPPCQHHMKKCTNYDSTPKCVSSCREGYNVSYEKDKRHGKRAYSVSGVGNMMAELYKNGPFVVVFAVYLGNYTRGVYHHVSGRSISLHAVKLMGWGVEEGKKYWLIANSWGTDFGENGYFKMMRGTNECQIEDFGISAGEPLLSDY